MHEIDFVLEKPYKMPIAVECKWRASGFNPRSLRSFRGVYPHGKNFVVAHDLDASFTKGYGEIEVTFLGISQLVKVFKACEAK